MSNTAIVLLKNGTKISDNLSEDEEAGLVDAWREYLSKPANLGPKLIQLKGLSVCAIFDPKEVAAVCVERPARRR